MMFLHIVKENTQPGKPTLLADKARFNNSFAWGPRLDGVGEKGGQARL